MSCGSSSSEDLRSRAPIGGDARVAADLEEHPVEVVLLPDLGQAGLGVHHHRAELVDLERLARPCPPVSG